MFLLDGWGLTEAKIQTGPILLGSHLIYRNIKPIIMLRLLWIIQLLQPEAYIWQSHLLSFASSLWILCWWWFSMMISWCWAECVWWCTWSLGHVFIHLSDGVEDQYKTQYWRWTMTEILPPYSRQTMQKIKRNISETCRNQPQIRVKYEEMTLSETIT